MALLAIFKPPTPSAELQLRGRLSFYLDSVNRQSSP